MTDLAQNAQNAPTRIERSRAAVKIARRGARHLARMVRPDGRFVYRYDSQTKRISEQYNVLRHCGAVWSMFEISRLTGADEKITDAAVLAARYMRDNFIRPYGDGDRLCVVDGQKIKLGGNGLALLALAEWHRLAPDPRTVDVAQRIGRFIVDQRTPEGDDLHHGRTYPGGELTSFRSNYYTGEALFGLLCLFEMTGEAAWRDAALDLLAPLGRRDYGVAERSHWMVYALDAADRIRPSPALRAYAGRIAEVILQNPETYRSRGYSTTIACMSEALLAYARMQRRTPVDTFGPSADACETAIIENLALQFASFRPNGAFLAGPNQPDVQIDYIQHNISAFAGYGVLVDSAEETADAGQL